MEDSSSAPLPAFIPLPDGPDALNSFPDETWTDADTEIVAAVFAEAAADFQLPPVSDPAALAATGWNVQVPPLPEAPIRRSAPLGFAVVAGIVLVAAAWLALRAGAGESSEIAVRTAQTTQALQTPPTRETEPVDPAAVPPPARPPATDVSPGTRIQIPTQSPDQRSSSPASASGTGGNEAVVSSTPNSSTPSSNTANSNTPNSNPPSSSTPSSNTSNSNAPVSSTPSSNTPSSSTANSNPLSPSPPGSSPQRIAVPTLPTAVPQVADRAPAGSGTSRPIDLGVAPTNGASTAAAPPAVVSVPSDAAATPVAPPSNPTTAPAPPIAAAASAESSEPGNPLSNLPRPSAASAPATASTAPPINSDQEALEGVLGRYRTAYSELDANGVQAIWPSVDARALARAFDQLERQAVSFYCGLSITGQQAVANCRGGTRYVPKVGNKSVRYDERQWRFQLRKTGDVWTIESVDSSR